MRSGDVVHGRLREECAIDAHEDERQGDDNEELLYGSHLGEFDEGIELECKRS